MRARALALLLVLAGGVAHAQPSQDSGLHVQTVSSPAPGTVQVLVAADPPHDGAIGAKPNAADFTVWLGAGAAPGLTVERNGGRGKPLTTVIVFDESGSYKASHGDKVAIPTIQTYINGAAGDELALVRFSEKAAAYPVRTSAADLKPDFVDLAKQQARGATSITVGVRAGIELAVREGEPGLREVIVFTDGGDEANASPEAWERVLQLARDSGVRVSAIVPAATKEPAQTDHGAWVRALTAFDDLAKATGGVYLATENATQAAKALVDARAALKSWLLLTAKLCGVQAGKATDVRVEYVPGHQRQAWSASKALASSAYAPGSDVACPSLCTTACAAWEECIGGACSARQCSAELACPAGATCVGGACQQACSETCAAWQECKAGACAAKTCTSDEVCGPGSRCASGACAQPGGKGTGLLVWILAGAGALLLLIALAVLFRKKPAPRVVEEVAPVPVPVPPAPPEEPRVAAPDLDPLPETHLVAMGGWATVGERWRLHQRRTVAGASGDPADGVDLRFAIKQVSGKHAAFDLYPSGDLWVTDLGSSNGTFVNGRKLAAKERAKLVPGDQVKLSQQLVLVVERPGVTPEPRAEVPRDGASAAAPSEAAAAREKSKKATRFDPGDR